MVAGRKLITGVRNKGELLGKDNYWRNYRCTDSISYVEIAMSTWNINLEKKTVTSINGITFKLTEVEPDVFRWICANPKNIPPDDLDDETLGRMVREADAMYQWQLKLLKR